MRVSVRAIGILFSCVMTLASAVQAQSRGGPGILLLAHGGAKDWNERVAAIAADVDRRQPVELALGMASRASIQAAADKLVQRGATSIVAVPLFISSHSSVIASTEYLLGLRQEAPGDLAMFAKMDHGGGSAEHAEHVAPAADPLARVALKVPVRMTAALDCHPIVAAILTSRALAISSNATAEAVVLVAHGPGKDDENRRWLDDMQVLAETVKGRAPFGSVDYLTVRDDAAAPIRDAAAAELRALVERRASAGQRVLVVPLLMSYGGIEAGIRKRLDGLAYAMATQGLAPDDRLAEWVLAVAGAR